MAPAGRPFYLGSFLFYYTPRRVDESNIRKDHREITKKKKWGGGGEQTHSGLWPTVGLRCAYTHIVVNDKKNAMKGKKKNRKKKVRRSWLESPGDGQREQFSGSFPLPLLLFVLSFILLWLFPTGQTLMAVVMGSRQQAAPSWISFWSAMACHRRYIFTWQMSILSMSPYTGSMLKMGKAHHHKTKTKKKIELGLHRPLSRTWQVRVAGNRPLETGEKKKRSLHI